MLASNIFIDTYPNLISDTTAGKLTMQNVVFWHYAALKGKD